MPAAAPRLEATTIRHVLVGSGTRFTGAERKLVRALLLNYPLSGLGTVAALAGRAGVSEPTVVRFVAKLGFASFATFQTALLGEVEARLHSPLMLMAARETSGGNAPGYLGQVAAALPSSLDETAPAEFERAIELLEGPFRRILFTGGRFSRFLAAIMEAHLRQLRPGTALLDDASADLTDRIVDLSPRDLVVIFDYRRYQRDVISVALQARDRGAKVILFTDPWGSPIADAAEVVLTARVVSPSAFDTMVPALAQVEAVVARLTERLGPAGRRRVEQLEAVRTLHAVTIDAGIEKTGMTEAAR